MKVGNLYKLGRVSGDSEEAYLHPKTYNYENDRSRIVAGVSDDGVSLISELIDDQCEPCFLLYVLHTPRGEGKAGRYQSPSLSPNDTLEFLTKFSDFLSFDSRFDLWIHSQQAQSTIVWDRHNLIYAYGDLGRVEKILAHNGFNAGSPSIAAPHFHHYHAEFDNYAKDILGFYEWSYTPLKPEDEQ